MRDNVDDSCRSYGAGRISRSRAAITMALLTELGAAHSAFRIPHLQ